LKLPLKAPTISAGKSFFRFFIITGLGIFTSMSFMQSYEFFTSNNEDDDCSAAAIEDDDSFTVTIKTKIRLSQNSFGN
jgi:hypothetical protein